MAQRISWSPPDTPADDVAARAEAAAQLDELVTALYESGLLRAMVGAVRASPELLGIAAEQLDAERVRTVVELGGLTTVVSAEGAERLVAAARSAVAAADHALADDPPTLLALARSLNDLDVRRGAGALLAAVGALGRSLAP